MATEGQMKILLDGDKVIGVNDDGGGEVTVSVLGQDPGIPLTSAQQAAVSEAIKPAKGTKK